ncbi:MAG: hypothetical protein COV44_07065 [Deltaproteobacteria bacterium CG11_big_fil_rev_8_21_14_0_20_45_16]|nr:MAG: hypothetical protein COV44_07065 [Deltaproteobacteria bacterium CG11_big_fil_rev_8_21_14_0_20_45_16]
MKAEQNKRETFVQITHNSFANQSRIFRETQSAAKSSLFGSIVLLGLRKDDRQVNNGFDTLPKSIVSLFEINLVLRRAKYLRMILRPFYYMEWVFRSWYLLKSKSVRVIAGHGITTLPIAIFLKLATGSKLLYDAHELETEQAGLNRYSKIIYKIVEFFGIRFVDHTLVVAPGIASWYEKRYRLCNIQVVRNFPLKSAQASISQSLKERLGISQSSTLSVYIGKFTPFRSIQEILDAYTKTRPDNHVVFIGHGPLESLIHTYQAAHPTIHFLESLEQSTLLSLLPSADFSLCLIQDVSLSYRYSLPNKLFESLAAGVPVLGSNLPEIETIIKTSNAGWLVEPTATAISEFVSRITKPEIEEKRQNAAATASELCWENEETCYLDQLKLLI